MDGWLSRLAGDELGVDEGDLLDVRGRRLKVEGRRLDLTRLEFQVLQFLTQRQGHAVSREVLRRQVWGHRGDGASNVVDVVIRSLRRKLGSRASTIETVSGVGYRFCPERVLATLLFVDIVGSTERAIALGDARWRALLDTFYTEVRKGVAHFEGWVATIRDAMAAHAVRTRAGVHTGECEIIGEDVTGIAVHVAARIAAAAGAGEVFASATVRDLVAGSGIRLSGRGLHQLKGVPGKQPLVAVDAMAEGKRLRATSGMTALPRQARTAKQTVKARVRRRRSAHV